MALAQVPLVDEKLKVIEEWMKRLGAQTITAKRIESSPQPQSTTPVAPLPPQQAPSPEPLVKTYPAKPPFELLKTYEEQLVAMEQFARERASPPRPLLLRLSALLHHLTTVPLTPWERERLKREGLREWLERERQLLDLVRRQFKIPPFTQSQSSPPSVPVVVKVEQREGQVVDLPMAAKWQLIRFGRLA